jgi:hypothetical protein
MRWRVLLPLLVCCGPKPLTMDECVQLRAQPVLAPPDGYCPSSTREIAALKDAPKPGLCCATVPPTGTLTAPPPPRPR